MKKYDFCGWATKNNVRCTDGRVIRQDAFKHQDGEVVPLVYSHVHDSIGNILGQVKLENRPEGVYAYGSFNNTSNGEYGRETVVHGDLTRMSIWANHVKQEGDDVVYGDIKEVSLVVGGANPGAKIETVLEHSDFNGETVIIESGEDFTLNTGSSFGHSDGADKAPEKKDEDKDDDDDDDGNETVGDVIKTMNEKQKKVLYAMVAEALKGKALKGNGNSKNSEEGDEVKHNVFDSENEQNVLSHDDMKQIFADAKRLGSLKDAVAAAAISHNMDEQDVISHAGITGATIRNYVDGTSYGVQDIDFLFPDARTIDNIPPFVRDNDAWVKAVISGTHHTPFSRVKSVFADITMDEARARGYTKGNRKKEEIFALLKRQTPPTTIYKKQKLDRDDIVDIVDFDVVAWVRGEMRGKLDEEIARAVLIGDGRSPASDDKISPECIRPVWTDDDLYTIKAQIVDQDDVDKNAKAFIKAAIRARKNYKGSGNPILFTTEDMLTDMLLLEDNIGHLLYDSQDKLATALRVSRIVTVPQFENLTRTVNGVTHTMGGLILNMSDYNIGADKGGAVAMFDDFDIDYNQQKYLIETRCSGALVKPFSAIALEFVPGETTTDSTDDNTEG